MQRAILAVLFLLLAAVAGIWFLNRGDVAPPPTTTTTAPTKEQAASEQATTPVATERPAESGEVQRVSVAPSTSSLLDDPEIRAGLTGFRGRVIDHAKQPVAGCGVRIYRGAMDSVLPEGVDVFADEPTIAPQYVGGEARTATDGTFQIDGVWPRGLHVLFAGIGTDAPMHQIVARTPSPGEVIDLGDIELPNAAVVVGTVVDEDGNAVAGALVRAADLPGQLAGFFPVERFDPRGALLIREASSPVRVVEMPAWVERAFADLPIPSTTTDGDGAFRLVGVVPGTNMVATTKDGFLSDLKASVQTKAGQEKNVGTIRLKRGEELTGKVVDEAGKPVADAEVLAGSTIAVAPVDLAMRVGRTDGDGKFAAPGFAPGKVTVAARRSKGHAWVLAEPQAILGDVVVTLPAAFAADVTVTLADQAPAKTARFRLLQGRAGDGAAEMAAFGFVPPLDLRDRLQTVAEGRWRITGLPKGKYTLCADAPGMATAFAPFEVSAADVPVALQLAARNLFTVRVTTADGKPVRNAAIIGEPVGKKLFEMPQNCGRTNADGRLEIDKFQAESLRVSADHPKWGVVHGECKLGIETTLVMQAPGSLHGMLLSDGKPAPVGHHTIALEMRRGDGPRGPLEAAPMLLSAGVDSSFTVAALQPGSYRLHAIPSLDALRSPGGLMGMMQDAWMVRDGRSEEFKITSGQVTEVSLETGEKPITGPTAHVFGTVTIDGRMAVGAAVMAYGNDRRFSAKVDAAGRFDFGQVPVGNLWVNVAPADTDSLFGGRGSNLWSASLELKEAEERELTVDVHTTSIVGVCQLPDGSPAAGVFVQANGRLKGSDGRSGNVWLGAPTDAQGRFEFKQVAEGTYQLNAQSNGELAARGKLADVVASGGVPVDGLRIQMAKTITVKGRVDAAAFTNQKPRWCWISFHRAPKDGSNALGDQVDGASVDEKDWTFSTNDLEPGNYQIRVYANYEDNKPSVNFRAPDLVVPAQGLEGVLLVLTREQ